MRILNRLEEVLIAVLMAAATVIIFLAIIQRYATGVPALYAYARTWDFTWAQELCIYMFVWMAKFGAGLRRAHRHSRWRRRLRQHAGRRAAA